MRVKTLQQGWKAVTVGEDGGYYSISAPTFGIVEYSTTAWTTPNVSCGPLAVFHTREDAQAFIGDAPSIFRDKIFPCLYAASKQTNLSVFPFEAPLPLLPPGTILADKVLLLAPEGDWE